MSRAALDDVLTWHGTARRLLVGIERLLARDPDALLSLVWPEEWTLQPADAVRENLAVTLRELDDYAVVALFGVFEGWLEGDSSKRRLGPESAGRLLSVYKERQVVPERIVAEVKEVKDYRDWVAHGRRWHRPPDVWPSLAHGRLSGFVGETEIAEEKR